MLFWENTPEQEPKNEAAVLEAESIDGVCLTDCLQFPCFFHYRGTHSRTHALLRATRSASACAADNLVVSCFQARAIHPDCAIISQHLRTREICSQTRRSEAQNQSDHSGGFVWRGCRALLRAKARFETSLGAQREVFNRQECGPNYKKRSDKHNTKAKIK